MSILGLIGLALPFVGSPVFSVKGLDLIFVDDRITFVALFPALSAITLVLSLIGARPLPFTSGLRVACAVTAIGSALLAAEHLSAHGVGLYVIVIANLVIAYAVVGTSKLSTVLLTLALVVVVVGGEMHVVHTRDGIQVCERRAWGARDLYTDFVLDDADYIGKTLKVDDPVVKSLLECGVITIATPEPEQTVKTYGACGTANNTGTCMDANDCTSLAGALRGLCPGPENIVCCIGR
jgi:hypothetical protein